MSNHFLRKYGESATIDLELYQPDGIDLEPAATFSAGDVKIMKDETAETNTTNLPTDEGQGYSLILTATEMQAARIVIYLVDSVTKIWRDKVIVIDTYGNASAQHAVDLDDSVRAGLSALPNAVAEAVGGLYTRGTGAGQINQPADGSVDVNAISAVAAFFQDFFTVDSGEVSGSEVSGSAIREIARVIWDRILTGATHNIPNSAGRRLRQIEAAFVLHDGMAQAGSSNTITLDSGANANDDFYNHARVVITDGTGPEQERIIVDYNGTTKVATIAPPWITNPDSTSVFEIEPAIVHAETNSKTVTVGLAQTGAANTITLASTESSITNFYKNDVISIDSGTGVGQQRIVTAYNGTTKVATIEPNWDINPDTTSEYIVEEALVIADIFAISNDIAAAINLKLDYNGTGYNKSASTIGTTTINTDMRGTDNAALATALITAQNDLNIVTGSDGVILATVEDVYHADIDLTIDTTNGKDEYTVTWFKNGIRIIAGITDPKVQVIRRSNGADLISPKDMLQIGSTGSYKYDELTNRIVGGEAVLVAVTATIDSGSRSFIRVRSRDSA